MDSQYGYFVEWQLMRVAVVVVAVEWQKLEPTEIKTEIVKVFL